MLHKNAARTTFPVIVSIAIALTITLALPLTAHAKTIFLGDSRTVGMYNTVAGYAPSGIVEDQVGDDAWKAAGGEGYTWFTSQALPYAERVMEPGDAIVILMGCNDLGGSRYADYADLLNGLAAQWKEDDISCFFVSVNPISDDLASSNGYAVHNSQVVAFNERIEPLLSEDVIWIDTYSILSSDGYNTFDGVHYAQSTCQVIYDECKAAVAEKEQSAAAIIAQRTAEAIEAENARQEAAQSGTLAYISSTTSAALDDPETVRIRETENISFPLAVKVEPTPITWIAIFVAAAAAILFVVSLLSHKPKEVGTKPTPRKRKED